MASTKVKLEMSGAREGGAGEQWRPGNFPRMAKLVMPTLC